MSIVSQKGGSKAWIAIGRPAILVRCGRPSRRLGPVDFALTRPLTQTTGSLVWEVRKWRRTMPTCGSIVCIRRFVPGRRSLLWTSFSTARTTPSLVRMPRAVLSEQNTQAQNGDRGSYSNAVR